MGSAHCGCVRELAMMDINEVCALVDQPAYRVLTLYKRGDFPRPAEAPPGTPLVWSRAAVEAWYVERLTAELVA